MPEPSTAEEVFVVKPSQGLLMIQLGLLTVILGGCAVALGFGHFVALPLWQGIVLVISGAYGLTQWVELLRAARRPPRLFELSSAGISTLSGGVIGWDQIDVITRTSPYGSLSIRSGRHRWLITQMELTNSDIANVITYIRRVAPAHLTEKL